MSAEIPETDVDGKILSSIAAPPGWKACYLASCDKTSNEAQIVVRPIILWVTIEMEEEDDAHITQLQEIRHFIIDNDGGIIDYEAYDLPFLCVVEPGDNVDEAAAKAIAYQLNEEEEAEKEEKDVC